MAEPRPLTSFKALSFDCYGTLVDWVSAIKSDLDFIITSLPPDHPWRSDADMAVRRLWEHARKIEQGPNPPTKTLVMEVALRKVAEEHGVSVSDETVRAFGLAAGSYPAFPDTVAGLLKLKKYYQLVILSNIDNRCMGEMLKGPLSGVQFDAVYTAEDAGTFKPSLATFEYLQKHVEAELGVDAGCGGELLHVARSLYADHATCKDIGMQSVWIMREAADGGPGAETEIEEYRGRVAYGWQFKSIGEFADEVERQFQCS